MFEMSSRAQRRIDCPNGAGEETQIPKLPGFSYTATATEWQCVM